MAPLHTTETEPSTANISPLKVLLYCFSVLAIGSVVLWLFFSSAPRMSDAITVEIQTGDSVREIATALKEAGVIRSELMLYALITGFHDPTNIHAGSYVFTPGGSLFAVANKLAANEVETNLVRLTFPEGIRLSAMADIAAAELEAFDTAEYLTATTDKEGYLWPETYFVPQTYTATDLVALQQATYEENITQLRPAIASSSLTEAEVIILASIIEREANDEQSMKMVSGILQNRLEIGMALQADATIEYILDTPLNALPEGQLAAELRETDSPYNTYKNVGLPPTPIGNPGWQAVAAAVYPTASAFFYYITGNDGEFYYARTLQEHNRNIELYLR